MRGDSLIPVDGALVSLLPFSYIISRAMSRSAKILLAACLVVVGLHLWGTLTPSHENWGVHFTGFYPPIIPFAMLAALILCSIPGAQQSLLDRLERSLRRLASLPPPIRFLLLAALLLGGIYLIPVKLHLLGDGAILLRSVQRGITGSEVTRSFGNQPLMFWIYRWAMDFHPVDASPDPYAVYLTIDVVAGLLFLLLIFWAVRGLQQPPVETVLLGCLLFLGAGSQFFFGYVENYVLLYVATAAYCITGWLALENRVRTVFPVALLVLMIMLHLGALVFLPSIALLLFLKYEKRRKQVIFLLAGATLAGILILSIMGFNPGYLFRHLTAGSVDFLQPFTATGGNFPYPMFSAVHLQDWLNSCLLMTPCGLVATLVLVFALPKDRRWRHPALLFLLTAAACGIFFTWVINSALGLARDWDLYSSFFVPLLVLPVFLFTQPVAVIPKRFVLTIVVLISLLHWLSWIGVNANADRYLARVRVLDSPKFLSLTTQLTFDEALANYFFDNEQYAEARRYYEHFLTIDSGNPRIIGNIADVYRKLGERDLYFRMLQRAVEIKSPDPGVYSNLGVEYAARGDTDRAIALNEQAVAINPTMAKALANLGILYTGRKNYTLADRYFTSAISLGMRDPLLLRYAGDVAVFLGNYEKALKNYDSYLSMVPGDPNVQAIRSKVFEAMKKGK